MNERKELIELLKIAIELYSKGTPVDKILAILEKLKDVTRF